MFQHQGAILRECIKNRVQHVLHMFGCNGPTKFLHCVLKVINNVCLLDI